MSNPSRVPRRPGATKPRPAAGAPGHVPPGASPAADVPTRGASRAPFALAAALATAYAAIYSWVCIEKFRYYLYDDFDFAIFAHAMERMLAGSLFNSVRGMVWLGDHTSLVLFLLAPVYAVFHHPATLLVVQSVALGLGVLPVFAIARRELGSDWAALGCGALYALYPAIGFTNLFEFHPETLATAALLWVFFGILERRRALTAIAAVVALACREEVALVVLPMALWTLRRHGRKGVVDASMLAGLAALSLAVSFAWLKPAFNLGEAGYSDMYRQWGATPGEIMAHAVRDPGAMLTAMFSTPGDALDTALKGHYYFYMLAPLAFLPLLSPLTCLIALPILAAHMLSWRQQQHTIIYQYTALITPVLMTAAIMGLRGIQRRFARPGSTPAADRKPGPAFATVIVAIAVAGAIVCNVWIGPLTGSGRVTDASPPQRIRPTAADRMWKPIRDRMIEALPRDGGLVAGFEFLSHVAGRQNLHSVHHVFQGTYTFSTRAYPIPDSISALLVDPVETRLRAYVEPRTGERLRELATRNRLTFAATAGDLMLLTHSGSDSLRPLRVGDAPPEQQTSVVFDGAMQFLGADRVAARGAAGTRVPLRTAWRLVQESDRSYVVVFALIDAKGQAIHRHIRHLGYVLQGTETWTVGTPVTERYTMLMPSGVPPGSYALVMTVGWTRGTESGYAEPDVAKVREAGGFIGLGNLEVLTTP